MTHVSSSLSPYYCSLLYSSILFLMIGDRERTVNNKIEHTRSTMRIRLFFINIVCLSVNWLLVTLFIVLRLVASWSGGNRGIFIFICFTRHTYLSVMFFIIYWLFFISADRAKISTTAATRRTTAVWVETRTTGYCLLPVLGHRFLSVPELLRPNNDSSFCFRFPDSFGSVITKNRHSPSFRPAIKDAWSRIEYALLRFVLVLGMCTKFNWDLNIVFLGSRVNHQRTTYLSDPTLFWRCWEQDHHPLRY